MTTRVYGQVTPGLIDHLMETPNDTVREVDEKVADWHARAETVRAGSGQRPGSSGLDRSVEATRAKARPQAKATMPDP